MGTNNWIAKISQQSPVNSVVERGGAMKNAVVRDHTGTDKTLNDLYTHGVGKGGNLEKLYRSPDSGTESDPDFRSYHRCKMTALRGPNSDQGAMIN